MRIRFEKITPAIAKKYLACNVKNRPVRQNHLKALINEMRQGIYLETHQGIAFNTNGELIDGQHRLMAVIESGATVTMPVARGLPVTQTINGTEFNTMDVIDRGPRRTVADQLKLNHGVVDANRYVAAMRTIARLLVDNLHPPALSIQQALFLKTHFGQSVETIAEACWGSKLTKSGNLIGAMSFGMSRDPLLVVKFAKQLSTGEDLSRGMPALTIRTYLENARGRIAHHSDGNRLIVTELVLNALWADLRGQSYLRCKRGNGGTIFFRREHSHLIESFRKLF